MDEKKDEITKRRKIRKILLLKINDELKEISESKPTLLINSQTIQEMEKVYNKNNILLSEKDTIYSNYVKTGIKIYPPCIKPIVKYKSVERKIEKSKIKLEIVGPSYDEEILSPILNFIPIKKNLYYKQMSYLDKRYTKNNGSIHKFIENNLKNNNDDNSLSKEDQLNQSTKIENNNLMKLIAKILSLKDNENMEKIIKRNIKKLRKYCYRFRKKKKKNKRYKSQENKIKNNNINIINNNSNNNNNNNLKLNSKNNEKEKEYRNSHFKVVPKCSYKRQKHYLSLKTNKRSSIKLKTLNEDESKKIIIKLHKMKITKPIKTENDIVKNKVITINHICNNDKEETVPNISEIKKALMRSSIERPTKLYDMNNCLTNVDKGKVKNNRKANKKKIMIRKSSLFKSKEIEKLKLAVRKDKKDKIELHDNLLVYKSNKKMNKLEVHKCENKNRNRSFAHKITKIKKPNISPKKSKKKLIESPERKIDYYSNCNTYYYTNVFNLTQSTEDKNNKMIRKKSKNEI